MAILLEDACLDALVSHLSGIPGLTVRKGFPESNKKLDLTEPVMAVTSIAPTRYQSHTKVKLSSEDISDTQALVTYRIGWAFPTYQMDLFAAYKVKRSEFAYLINEAMKHNVEGSADLLLEAEDYYNANFRLTLTDTRPEDDQDNAPKGIWRMIYTVECVCPELRQETVTKMSAVTTTITTEVATEEVTEVFEIT